VVQIDLADAKLAGSGVARVFGDLRGGRGGQYQIVMKVRESCHVTLVSCDVAGVLTVPGSGSAGCPGRPPLRGGRSLAAAAVA
jgi:hypothetical protein